MVWCFLFDVSCWWNLPPSIHWLALAACFFFIRKTGSYRRRAHCRHIFTEDNRDPAHHQRPSLLLFLFSSSGNSSPQRTTQLRRHDLNLKLSNNMAQDSYYYIFFDKRGVQQYVLPYVLYCLYWFLFHYGFKCPMQLLESKKLRHWSSQVYSGCRCFHCLCSLSQSL